MKPIFRKRKRDTVVVAIVASLPCASAFSTPLLFTTTTRTTPVNTAAKTTFTRLSVLSDPQRSADPFLFGGDEDENDPLLGSNPFLDIYDDDVAEETNNEDLWNLNNDEEKNNNSFRDDAQMLEEREDRFYVDETGVKRRREQCLLVGVEDTGAQRRNNNADGGMFSLMESLTEMRELIHTAGLELTGEVTQRLPHIHPRTYIGTGKVEQVKDMLEEKGDACCTVVFDAELSPGQQKALEKSFNKKLFQDDFHLSDTSDKIKVVDRTALILDIFAQHAKTREGKLQVDLALHEYRKPRLTKLWTHLERQSGAGGVGLRGMGESQLEIDKRLVRDRILVLQKKINAVQKQRTIHRRQRDRLGLPVIALVGYTNAGKSSLLNALSSAGVLAESMLFATLDPTTRKVKLPGMPTEVLLTDTVGFIQKLPTHLVAAFRATLEEVEHADILVHVIDASNPSWPKQEQAVGDVLNDLGVDPTTPVVRVLNKMDLVENDNHHNNRLPIEPSPDTVAMSALYGDGIANFVTAVEHALAKLLVPMTLELPFSMGQEVARLHEQGHVQAIEYRPTGTWISALVPAEFASRLEQYRVQEDGRLDG